MDIYWVEKFPLMLQIASLLIVFIILAVLGQRKTWISTEVIMAAALGSGMTIFPRYLLNYQVVFNVLASSYLDGQRNRMVKAHATDAAVQY